MNVSPTFVLTLIGVILIFLSAVPPLNQGVSLWNLGWGFVLTGVFLVGKGVS